MWFSLGYILTLFPFENLFISFDSPEAVYNYMYTGAVVDVIEGENSCWVFAEGSGPYIVLKTDTGYKIASKSSVKTISNDYVQNEYLIYHVQNTSDYYIYGTEWSESKEVSIIDSNGIIPNYIVRDLSHPDWEIYSIAYYAYVSELTDDYYIRINDKRITFAER